jgi:osmotically-inducible protein OsmY
VKRYFFALVLAVAMTGLAQAASVPVSGAVAPKAAQAVPLRRGLSDSQIEREIRARLARSKMTLAGKEKFTVSVKDGVATLEGKTNVIQHKGVATRLARLSGAIAVQNRIEVSEEAKAKAAARLAKGRATATGGPVRARVMP